MKILLALLFLAQGISLQSANPLLMKPGESIGPYTINKTKHK